MSTVSPPSPRPRIIAPQSPRRARGCSRASWQAGHSQKNAGTPQPAPVPMNVNVWVKLSAMAALPLGPT